MKNPDAAGLDINEEENMSTDKWAYSPKRCEGQNCPGDCDFCELWKDDDEQEEQEIMNARRGEE